MPEKDSTLEALSEVENQLEVVRKYVRQLATAGTQPAGDIEGKLQQVQLIYGHKLLPQGSTREKIARRALRSYLSSRRAGQNDNRSCQQILDEAEELLNALTVADASSLKRARAQVTSLRAEVKRVEDAASESLRFREESLKLGGAQMFANFRKQEREPYSGDAPAVQIVAFYRGRDPRTPSDEFVTAALKRPAFANHRAPLVPLRPIDPAKVVSAVVDEDCRLAEFHGVAAFAVDFYWHHALHCDNAVLRAIAGKENAKLKFCANWRPSEGSAVDGNRCTELYNSLQEFWSNPRYLKLGGRPLLVIETSAAPSDFEDCVRELKSLSSKDGQLEPYVIYAALAKVEIDPKKHGFDGLTRMAPHREFSDQQPMMMYKDRPALLSGLPVHPNLDVFSYSGIVGHLLRFLQTPTNDYQTVFTSYNAFERFKTVIYAFSKPEAFQAWLQRACSAALAEGGPEHPVVFVKSWNDWNAGAHLLPDLRTGYAHLTGIKNSLVRSAQVLALRSPEAQYLANDLHATGLANEKEDLAKYIKNHPGKNPIILYQIGKVGSSTVIKSMRAVVPKEPILGMHNLTKLKEGITHALAHLPDPSEALGVLHQGLTISEWMEGLGDDYKFNVITMVKDPISRNISHFFHAVESFWPMFRYRLTVGDITMEEVRDTFLGLFLSFRFEHWFMTHFEPVFPIDAANIRYEPGKGYAIAESPTGKYRVMVMRSEDITRVLPAATKEFIGIEVPVLKRANTAEDKFYSDVYLEFKKLPLPAWYVDHMLTDKVVENFYSTQEREEMFYKYTTGS